MAWKSRAVHFALVKSRLRASWAILSTKSAFYFSRIVRGILGAFRVQNVLDILIGGQIRPRVLFANHPKKWPQGEEGATDATTLEESDGTVFGHSNTPLRALGARWRIQETPDFERRSPERQPIGSKPGADPVQYCSVWEFMPCLANGPERCARVDFPPSGLYQRSLGPWALF